MSLYFYIISYTLETLFLKFLCSSLLSSFFFFLTESRKRKLITDGTACKTEIFCRKVCEAYNGPSSIGFCIRPLVGVWGECFCYIYAIWFLVCTCWKFYVLTHLSRTNGKACTTEIICKKVCKAYYGPSSTGFCKKPLVAMWGECFCYRDIIWYLVCRHRKKLMFQHIWVK